MTQTARKPASTKKATILKRNEKGNGKVETIVLSSNGVDEYTVVSVNHVVESCECAYFSHTGKVCYHVRSVQIAELDIEEQQAAYDIVAEAAKVAQDAEKKLDEKLYEELGKTKKTAAQREAEARKKAEQKRNNASLNGDGGFRMFR